MFKIVNLKSKNTLSDWFTVIYNKKICLCNVSIYNTNTTKTKILGDNQLTINELNGSTIKKQTIHK